MIKIKCPNCGAPLNIKEVPGIEDKVIHCPVCDENNPFSKFKPIVQKSHDDTQYIKKSTDEDQTTQLNTNEITVITGNAYLVDRKTRKTYRLDQGVNYVGRKADSTPKRVNVRIETSDMGFSRAHMSLGAVMQGDVCKYRIKNDENKNMTFVNGAELDKEDVVYLKDNDIIKSSSVELQFRLK